MSEVVLRTVGLGKMYRIGTERAAYRTLRDALVQAAMRPVERIRHPGAATHASEVLWALKDIDLEVRQGDVLGIIGRNGAGKSTLLKVLSRITEPTEGRVEVKGRVGSLLEVGTGFHGELTGRENIYLNGAILGMTRAEIKRRFDEMVEFSEIGRFLDTPVKRYSSGMYVRLAFAVAAHLNPEILIVDEVLSVGDAEFQKKCLGKMEDVAGHGRTVFFVSHNMAAVEGLCSSAILLDKGRVVERGSVGSVIDMYVNTRSATAVNFAGVLARSKDGAVELEGVRVTDSDGNPLAGAKCGGDMYMEVVVHSAVDVDSVNVSVGFNDAHGKRIAVLDTSIAGFTFPLTLGRQSFVCRVDRMPLSPGVYELDAHIYDRAGTIVEMPHGPSLDVSGGDYHGTGRMPDEKWGGVTQLTQLWSDRR